jgi:hypothetical protein
MCSYLFNPQYFYTIYSNIILPTILLVRAAWLANTLLYWITVTILSKENNLKSDCSHYAQCSSVIAGLHPQSPPSFCMETFSASITNFTALLPQSHDYSCFVSRRILAPPPTPIAKTHLYMCTRLYALCRHQSRIANVTCVWRWRHRGINPVIFHLRYLHIISYAVCSQTPREEDVNHTFEYLNRKV